MFKYIFKYLLLVVVVLALLWVAGQTFNQSSWMMVGVALVSIVAAVLIPLKVFVNEYKTQQNKAKFRAFEKAANKAAEAAKEMQIESN